MIFAETLARLGVGDDCKSVPGSGKVVALVAATLVGSVALSAVGSVETSAVGMEGGSRVGMVFAAVGEV